MAQLDEIISKSTIQGIIDADTEIIKLDADFKNLLKTAKDLANGIGSNVDSFAKLKAVQDQTIDQTKKLSDAEKQAEKIAKEQAAAMASLEKQRQKAYEQMAKQEQNERELAAAINMEVKSVNDARKQNEALHKARNNVNLSTAEGRKQAELYNKAINKNTEFIRKNVDATTKQKMNIGNYTNSIKAALGSMGPFGTTVNNITNVFSTFRSEIMATATAQKAAAVGTGFMTKAINFLKVALISSGIGAIVVLLGSLYAYFTKSAEGADKFARFMAQVGAVVDVLIDRFAKFGEGLIDIFSGRFKEGAEKISASFKGIGTELKEEVKTAGEIADKLDEIDDKRRKYQEQIAKNQIRIAQLEEIARNKEDYSLEQRKAAIDEIMGLKRADAAMTKELNQAEVDQINKQGELRMLNDEEQQKLTDARIKLMNEEAAAQSDINSSLKLRNTIYAAINEQQAQLTARALSEQQTLTEQSALGAQQIELDIHAKTLEMREQMDIDFAAREDERLKEKQEKQLKAAHEYVARTQEMGQTLLDFTQFLLDTEVSKMEAAKAYELQLAGDNAEKRTEIEKKYEKEAAKLKAKQARQDKAQALFNAIIKTAQAILAGLAYGPPLGYVFAAINAALGAIQVGVIASQPIPQFFKGTESAPDGLISVGEKGRELIQTKSGKLLMANKRTVLSGMKGAQIYSNKETEEILKLRNVGYDSGEIRKTLKENNQELIRTIKNKKEIHITPAQNSRITERQGEYYKTYFKRKLG